MTGKIDVVWPVDGRVVATVPDETPEAVADAVAELREHQRGWERIGPARRAHWLRLFRDWLLRERDRLTDVLQSETGKVRHDAAVEVPFVCEAISYFARNAEDFLADERLRPAGALTLHKRLTVVHHPFPVVGVITPWNFPILIPGADVITALLAGSAVLLKPSEVTPLSALEMARGWREIGAPPVFTVLTGGAETGRALVDSVDYVQFTGSTRTGQAIAHRCVDRMIPYGLELGGKDPAIVLADADLDRAAAGVAWGALFNSGQACVSFERVYVEAPVHDEFVAKLVRRVDALRQGDDDWDDLGAMATPAQREIAERHIAQALSAGARALTGGKPAAGENFVAPTVLVDVDDSMDCLWAETFGPTIPVVRVADAEEAITLANRSRYGLSAAVFTRDRARGEQIARRLEVGAVNVNDVYVNLFAMNLPHGGWKESGVGARLGGASGLLKYTRRQAITAPQVAPLPWEPLWFPYSAHKGRFIDGLLRAVAGRGMRRFLS